MNNNDVPRVTEGVSRVSLHSASVTPAVRVDRISYHPGAHTHWHLHTGEQVLYGEAGHGWVAFAGQQRISVRPGEVVHVGMGLPHWHGATTDADFRHLAVTAGGDTVWLGELTEAAYTDPADVSGPPEAEH